MSFWSIIAGIIANIITSSVAILFILLTVFRLAKLRGRRLKFFKISRSMNNPTISIFIANLFINKGGASYVDGNRSRHFSGSAVPVREVDAARLIEKKLDLGVLRIIPDWLRGRILWVSDGLINVNITLAAAPRNNSEIMHLERAIIIGGPEFNAAAGYFLNKSSIFRIVDPNKCNKPKIAFREGGFDHIIEPTAADHNLGIVQRVSFIEDQQVILLLSGIGSNGTLAAVDCFLRHWDEINGIVDSKDFGICIQCPKREIDPNGYKHWIVIREFPEGILRQTGLR